MVAFRVLYRCGMHSCPTQSSGTGWPNKPGARHLALDDADARASGEIILETQYLGSGRARRIKAGEIFPDHAPAG